MLSYIDEMNTVLWLKAYALESIFPIALFGIHALLYRQFVQSIRPGRSMPLHTNQCEDITVQLVVDIGSTSVRCSAFYVKKDTSSVENIRLIPRSIMRRNTPPFIQGNVDTMAVVEAVNAVVGDCITYLRSQGISRISKLGFASLAMNIFGVDRQNRIVTPTYTYASELPDISSLDRPDSALLRSELLTHYANTGTVLHHPCYATVHLKQYYYDFFDNTKKDTDMKEVHRWTTICSFILGIWTGIGINCPVSYSEVSWWGLLSLSSVDDEGLTEPSWDTAAVQRLHEKFPIQSLPPIIDFDEFLETIRGKYLLQWPELKDCTLYLGIGDGAAANIGSEAKLAMMYQNSETECILPAPSGCITVGTSAAVRIVSFNSDQEFKKEALLRRELSDCRYSTPIWKYRIDKTSCLIGGSLTDGGSLVDWFSKCFGATALAKALCDLDELVFIHQNQPSWRDKILSERQYGMIYFLS